MAGEKQRFQERVNQLTENYSRSLMGCAIENMATQDFRFIYDLLCLYDSEFYVSWKRDHWLKKSVFLKNTLDEARINLWSNEFLIKSEINNSLSPISELASLHTRMWELMPDISI